MEGNATKYDENNKEANNFPEECSIDENSQQEDGKIPTRSLAEISQEEETLKAHLDKLKKENFTLQASIKAWEATLQDKLDEFKQADLKLDDIHNEIWSERERFCSRADEFTDAYGIFSDWWATQLEFVSDLENLEKKTLEHRKRREEIEKLEKEVEDLKKEIGGLQAGRQLVEVEVHAAEDEDYSPVRGEDTTGEVSPDAKKPRFSHETENVMYSIVDLEKLRMVNRHRNRQRKTTFLAKSRVS